MRKIVFAAFAAAVLFCPAAMAQYETALICDAVVAGRCATVAADGSLKVGATVNVSGAADLAGNTATFSANNICSAVLTAGLQSVGFHLDAGTLAATLTAFGTNNIGAVNCATAGTCTAISTSAGATLIVTNPNGVKDVSISALPGMRQVQMCTTSFSSGTAAGVVTGTYLNASSSGGGGGTVIQGAPNSAANAWPTSSTFSGSLIDPRAIRALTVSDIVGLGAGSAIVGKFGIDQTTPGTTNGVQVTAALPAGTNLLGKTGIDQTTPGTTNLVAAGQNGTWTMQPGNTANTTSWLFKIDQTTPGTTNGVQINGTATTQGPGTANSPSGGVSTFQPPAGATVPMPIYTPGGTLINAAEPDNTAPAATLTTACTAQTACLGTASIQWPMNGNQGATLTIVSSVSALGTSLACDQSWDGVSGTPAGVTYLLNSCDLWQLHGAYRKGALTNADAIAAAATPTQWIIYAPGSPSHIRIRMATFTSGSVAVAGRGTMAPNPPFPFWQKPQSTGTVTLTASTAETTLLAGVASTFLDLTDLACHTTVASSNVITVRDSTGGTTRKTIICPATIGPCEGWTFTAPLQQAAVNTNWTAQAASSTSSVICDTAAVQR